MTSIPYQVNKRQLIKNMADQVEDKRLEGISDIRDETDRNGMRIVIELKRDANPQVVLNRLFAQTQLPDGHPATAGGVGGADARPAHNDGPGGEVGAVDVLHQVAQGGLRVIQNADHRVDDLPHIVGRDVGGHAHGDAAGRPTATPRQGCPNSPVRCSGTSTRRRWTGTPTSTRPGRSPKPSPPGSPTCW